MKIDTAIRNKGFSTTQLFFLGCWYNMCHEQSLDSDRVSTVVPKNGLLELVDLYTLGNSYRGEEKRVDASLELKEILEDDLVLNTEIFKELKDKLVDLFNFGGGQPQHAKVNSKEKLVKSILHELLQRIDNSYITKAFELLENSIEEDVDRHNEEDSFNKIHSLCNSLIGTLVSNGSSLQDAVAFYRHILTKNIEETSFGDRFSHLREAATKPPIDYEVEFKVISHKLVGLLDEHDEDISFEHFTLKKVEESLCSVSTTVKASSYTIAGQDAYEKLGELVDAISYAIGKDKIIIQKKYICRELSGNKQKTFEIHRPVPNPNYQFKKDKFIRFMKSLEGDSTTHSAPIRDKKISSAFRLYRIGELSENIEARFTSYWTSLESITRDTMEGDSGDDRKVIHSVIPCIASDYVCKRLSAFIRALHNIRVLNISYESKEVNLEGMSNSEFYIQLKDTHFANALLSELDQYPYFKFTLSKFITNVAKPEEMGLTLEKHESKVERQLKRIYRTRNLIIHNADKIKSLELLCANLEHYLKICLNSMIDLMYRIPTIKSADECFVRYRDIVDSTKLQLNPALKKPIGNKRNNYVKNNSKSLSYSDELLMEIIKLHE